MILIGLSCRELQFRRSKIRVVSYSLREIKQDYTDLVSQIYYCQDEIRSELRIRRTKMRVVMMKLLSEMASPTLRGVKEDDIDLV